MEYQDPDFSSLVKGIRGLTVPQIKYYFGQLRQQYNIQYYVRSSSKYNWRPLRFECPFSTEYNCKSYIVFESINNNHLYQFCSADFSHTHDISQFFYEMKKQKIDEKTQYLIQEYTSMGIPPTQIRVLLNLNINTDVFYNIRRPILQNIRQNQFECLKNETIKWNGYKTIFHLNSQLKQFSCLTIINLRIINQPFSKYLCFCDDSMCTNTLKLPLIVLLTADPNSNSQLIAWGFLPDKTTESFSEFFTDIYNYIQPNLIKTLMMDRNAAQKQASLHLNPELTIQYCVRHIRNNIIKQFTPLHPIMNLFNSFISKNITEEEYCVNLSQFETNDNKKFIKKLLKDIPHYNSFTKTLNRNEDTNNRSEGFFGNVKLGSMDNQTLLNCSKIIKNLSDMALRKLYSASHKLPETILETKNNIGSIAIEKIIIEIEKAKESIDRNEECNCEIVFKFGIPCYHYIIQRMKDQKVPLIEESAIHPINFYTTDFSDINPIVECIEKDIQESSDYHSTMAVFREIAAEQKTNKKVKELSKNFIQQYKSIKESNGTDPSIIKTPGQKDKSASKYVLSGKPKRKTQYTCSICHSINHTKSRCPNNIVLPKSDI